jgi:branched-chain amino acid transport system substrate-binding protein
MLTALEQGDSERRRSLSPIVIGLVCAIAAAFAAGCGSSDSSSGTGGGARSTSAEKGGTIKIGVIQPLSGDLAETGNHNLDGLKFAADQINAAGGIKSLGGAKLKLIAQDDAGQPQNAIQAAAKMAKSDKVAAIIGAYTSSETIPLAQSMDRLKIPLIAATAASDLITNSGYKFVTRLGAPASANARAQVEFLKSGTMEKAGYPPIRRVATLVEDGDFGTAWRQGFLEDIKATKLQHVADVRFTSGSSSVSPQMTKIAAAKPDIVVTCLFATDAVLVTRAAKALGMTNTPFLDASGAVPDPAFVTGLKDQANHWYSTDSYNSGLPGQEALGSKFQAKYQYDLTGDNANNIQAVWLLAAALEKAGSTDPGKLNDTLHGFDMPKDDAQNVLSFNGDLKINAQTGQNDTARYFVEQVQDKQLKIIWPDELAQTKIQKQPIGG